MKRLVLISLVLLSTLSSFAFSQPKRVEPVRDSITFEKKKIELAGQTLTVEIADTDPRRARGLMFRTKLSDSEGMLFLFDREEPLAFWMKNTLIPLSIAYFDRHKKIVDIQEMVPPVTGEMFPRTYPSKAPAQFALEMPKGWFSRKGVKAGASFRFVEGSGN